MWVRTVTLLNIPDRQYWHAMQIRLPGQGDALRYIAALFWHMPHTVALQHSAAQGLYLTTAFYWDRNDASREWSKRYFERTQKMPTMAQAGVYSSVMHYLKSVRETGTTDTATVRKHMGETPVNDMFTTNGVIRADGRMMNDLYLAQVKTPAESKYPWDYYKIVGTIPARDAFRTEADSVCGLLSRADERVGAAAAG